LPYSLKGSRDDDSAIVIADNSLPKSVLNWETNKDFRRHVQRWLALVDKKFKRILIFLLKIIKFTSVI